MRTDGEPPLQRRMRDAEDDPEPADDREASDLAQHRHVEIPQARGAEAGSDRDRRHPVEHPVGMHPRPAGKRDDVDCAEERPDRDEDPRRTDAAEAAARGGEQPGGRRGERGPHHLPGVGLRREVPDPLQPILAGESEHARVDALFRTRPEQVDPIGCGPGDVADHQRRDPDRRRDEGAVQSREGSAPQDLREDEDRRQVEPGPVVEGADRDEGTDPRILRRGSVVGALDATDVDDGGEQ